MSILVLNFRDILPHLSKCSLFHYDAVQREAFSGMLAATLKTLYQLTPKDTDTFCIFTFSDSFFFFFAFVFILKPGFHIVATITGLLSSLFNA
jgi:hypothetical protein